MKENLFDLNIETVLENWSVADALREIIANALDETFLAKSQPIKIEKDFNNIWHIRDYGRGIQYIHFTQNENEEKINSDKLIGKFGVGLKDALAVFHRHNCSIIIDSKYNHITITMANKSGFDIQTLHAKFEPSIDETMIGTDFTLINVTDNEIYKAKSQFLVFNDLTLLEKTRYGEVYQSESDGGKIYINGVKVASESNFMFDYNITNINAAIRKALNRERSNVGRTAYADTIKNILKICESDKVLKPLVDDLKNRMLGTNKDETAWVDVATHAAKTLNKSGKVVFMTPNQRNNLTNFQLEMLQESGKSLVMVTDDVYGKIKQDVITFSNVYKDYNDSYQYNYVDYSELSDKEKQVFDLRIKVINLLKSNYKICKNIKISETIRITQFGEMADGVLNNWNEIIIRRTVLSDPIRFCGVLAHELGHYQHNYEDNTKNFENDLTSMLGYSIYQAISS